MMSRSSLLSLAILLLACSCTPSRYVRPLEQGQKAVSVTLGGPIFTNYGAPIPIPFTTVAGAYGLKDDLTLYAGFHTTSIMFGVVQFDLGAVYAPARPDGWRPGLSLSPALNIATDIWQGNFKVWPQLDVNVWWEYGSQNNLVYTGLSGWYEFAGTKAHGETQEGRTFPSFQVGHTFTGPNWDLNTEVKYSDFLRDNNDLTISYIGPGQKGALGIFLGLTRKF